MNIIVVSDPEFVEQETVAINALFEEGLQTLHLRKPLFEKIELENILLSIKPKFLKRIVIHSHYELIDKYNLKGIHFPERMLLDIGNVSSSIEKIKRRRMTVSASFHSVENLRDNTIQFNYVFISPIYDSLSKPGYKRNIDLLQLSDYLTSNNKIPKVIALGGIDKSKRSEIEKVGFDGLAMLGGIWNDYKKSADIAQLLERYRNIIEPMNVHARQA